MAAKKESLEERLHIRFTMMSVVLNQPILFYKPILKLIVAHFGYPPLQIHMVEIRSTKPMQPKDKIQGFVAKKIADKHIYKLHEKRWELHEGVYMFWSVATYVYVYVCKHPIYIYICICICM